MAKEFALYNIYIALSETRLSDKKSVEMKIYPLENLLPKYTI